MERLFADPEGLNRVELHEMVLHRDGPRLQLRFQLPRFPDRPAPRWHPESNAVQITMSFWGVDDLTVGGWSTGNLGDLGVHGESPYRLRLAGEGLSLGCTFAGSRVDGVSAYLEGSG